MKFVFVFETTLQASWNPAGWNTNNSPAFNGLGTPPTKTVFLGSNGNEASSTKSASLNLQGRIWTGLSLMVGLETHKYSLSSSWMQASIKAWTDDSSWKEIKYFQFLLKIFVIATEVSPFNINDNNVATILGWVYNLKLNQTRFTKLLRAFTLDRTFNYVLP